MSFILDALKKSESDRQRQSGPALFEVKVAPPRARLPLWALAIVALLVVNLGIVVWLLWRHSAATASTPPVAAAPLLPAPTATAPKAAVAQSAAPVSAAPLPATAPPIVIPPATGAPAPEAAAPPAAANSSTPAAAGSADPQNPADFAPATEANGALSLNNHVHRGTSAGVPLYQDAMATPGTELPQLRLDLHAYAERPQDRWVMINMQKVHEGDVLRNGVHIDTITPDGAILSYNGMRFLLPRE
jgi:general secretion pathway protein B